MKKNLPLYLAVPLLLISCQEKAKVAPVIQPDSDSEERIAVLEEKLDHLEEKLVAEQNLRLKQNSEQTEILRELKDLFEKSMEKRVPIEPVAGSPVEDAPAKSELDEQEVEARRVARLKAIGEEHELLVTTKGEPFHDIVISRVTDIGVTFRHKGGIARVAFPDLPAGWRDRFYYDRDLALAASKSEELAQLRYNKAVRDQLIAKKEEDEMKRREISLARLAKAVEDFNQPRVVPVPAPANDRIIVNPPIVVHDNSYVDDVYCPPVVSTPVVRTPTRTTPLIRSGNHGQSRSTTPAPRPTPTVVRPSRPSSPPPSTSRSRPTPQRSSPAVQPSRSAPAPQPRPSTPRPAIRRSR